MCIYIGIGVDVDMDLDSDMAAFINWGDLWLGDFKSLYEPHAATAAHRNGGCSELLSGA